MKRKVALLMAVLAVFGITLAFASGSYEPCSTCRGTGICVACNGAGSFYNFIFDRNVRCPGCNGTGRCYPCGGTGRNL